MSGDVDQWTSINFAFNAPNKKWHFSWVYSHDCSKWYDTQYQLLTLLLNNLYSNKTYIEKFVKAKWKENKRSFLKVFLNHLFNSIFRYLLQCLAFLSILSDYLINTSINVAIFVPVLQIKLPFPFSTPMLLIFFF